MREEIRAVDAVIERIYADECAKLQRLYQEPTADFRFIEKNQLIKMALNLQGTAGYSMRKLFTELKLSYPDTLWRRIESKISVVAYVSCDWSRVDKLAASIKLEGRTGKNVSAISKAGKKMRDDALSCNKKVLKKWCADLKECTLKEIVG